MLIDFVPIAAGESLRKTSGFVKAPGGAPANVAVAIARLGGNSAFIGKVRGIPCNCLYLLSYGVYKFLSYGAWRKACVLEKYDGPLYFP